MRLCAQNHEHPCTHKDTDLLFYAGMGIKILHTPLEKKIVKWDSSVKWGILGHVYTHIYTLKIYMKNGGISPPQPCLYCVCPRRAPLAHSIIRNDFNGISHCGEQWNSSSWSKTVWVFGMGITEYECFLDRQRWSTTITFMCNCTWLKEKVIAKDIIIKDPYV